MNKSGLKVCALSCAAFVLVIAFAGARSAKHPVAGHQGLSSTPTGKVTPWAAMGTAAAKTGGKPFQATFEFEDGRWQYGVLVVKAGKIFEVEINATTGVVGDVEGITPGGEAKEFKSELEGIIKRGGK